MRRPTVAATRPPGTMRVVQRKDRKVEDQEIWAFVEPFIQKARRFDRALAPCLKRSNLELTSEATATDPSTGKIKLSRIEAAKALMNWSAWNAAKRLQFETEYLGQLLHEAEHSLGVRRGEAVPRPDSLRGRRRSEAWAREEHRATSALIGRLSGIVKRFEERGQGTSDTATRLKQMIFIQKRYRWEDWVGPTFYPTLFLAEVELDRDWKELTGKVTKLRSILEQAKQPESLITKTCKGTSRNEIGRLEKKHAATLEALAKKAGLTWKLDVDDRGMPRRWRVDTRFTFGKEEKELYSTEPWAESR